MRHVLLVELSNLDAHQGSLHWIIWNQLQALIGSSDLQRVVGDNIALGDELARWDLEYGSEACIKVFVPLGFVVEVYEDLLECNLFADKSPTGPCNERTQVMAVHAEIVCVSGWLGLIASWPHEPFKCLKLWLSVRLERLCGDHS